jgi:IrrE N-terminal-like domain
LSEKNESGKKAEAKVVDFDEIAENTLSALGIRQLPVNPYEIATEEGIELAAGLYGERFDARIEYIRSVDTFILYYRSAQHGRTEGRVRFSLAHELGHFYLPGHRAYLLSGKSHNSVSDFRSRDPREEEADEFAAALLMPRKLFAAELKTRRLTICTLADLSRLADAVFETSLTSTVRRYCQFDWEACSMVVSEGGTVKWAKHSDSMRALGLGFIEYGMRVPNTSPTAKLWERLKTEKTLDRVESRVDPELWYNRSHRSHLWEEAMPLGYTGQVLTFLTLEDTGRDDADDD